jgi:hypothetical protein
VGGEVVQDDVDHLAVEATLSAALDGGQGVGDALTPSHHSPDRVVGVVVATMELAGAAVLLVVGPEPLGVFRLRPATAAHGVDSEGAELVEGEDALGELGYDLLDPVELFLLVRVVGLLPGLGPLEGDLVLGEDLAQALAAELDPPEGVGSQVVA